jgi:L-histidine N-alpha-methyltransferase
MSFFLGRTAVLVKRVWLDLEVRLAAGEEIHTEISAKFRRERVAEELRGCELEVGRWWTDPGEGFGVALARRL